MWEGVRQYWPLVNRVAVAVRLGCFGGLGVNSAVQALKEGDTKSLKDGTSDLYSVVLGTTVISAIDHSIKAIKYYSESENPELHKLKAAWEAVKGAIVIGACGTVILIKADAISEDNTAKAFMALLGAVGVESIGVAIAEYGLAGFAAFVFAAAFATGIVTGASEAYCVAAMGAFSAGAAVAVGRKNLVQAVTCIRDSIVSLPGRVSACLGGTPEGYAPV
jgi:hypothetical protein